MQHTVSYPPKSGGPPDPTSTKRPPSVPTSSPHALHEQIHHAKRVFTHKEVSAEACLRAFLDQNSFDSQGSSRAPVNYLPGSKTCRTIAGAP